MVAVGLQGRTPLHHAAYANDAETIKVMLRYGADVKAVDIQVRCYLCWLAKWFTNVLLVGSGPSQRKVFRLSLCRQQSHYVTCPLSSGC